MAITKGVRELDREGMVTGAPLLCQLPAMSLESGEDPGFVGRHEPAISGYVSSKDRCQAAFH